MHDRRVGQGTAPNNGGISARKTSKSLPTKVLWFVYLTALAVLLWTAHRIVLYSAQSSLQSLSLTTVQFEAPILPEICIMRLSKFEKGEIHIDGHLITRKGAAEFDKTYLNSLNCSMYELRLIEDVNSSKEHSGIAIVTASTNTQLMFDFKEAFWNRALYCKLLKYYCLFYLAPVSTLEGRGTHFVKLKAINDALKLIDVIMWIDIDAFFSTRSLKLKTRIEDFIPTDMWSLSNPVTIVFGNWNLPFINSGLMIIRNSPMFERLVKNWWDSAQGYKDQPALWHSMFTELEQYANRVQYETPCKLCLTLVKNSSVVYSDQLLNICRSMSYTKCIRGFHDWWSVFFGGEDPEAGRYPFFYVHPKVSTPSLDTFHCILCKDPNSFVIHTGNDGWKRLKLIDQTAVVSAAEIQ